MSSHPPALPPRSPSIASSYSSWSSGEGRSYSPNRPRVNTIHLTPQTRYAPTGEKQTHPYSGGTGLDDPRSSSTQSLQPTESPGPNRRKLLLVYIHGFMGTETSFKSFPAHVHNVLSISLADTHVVHTKIYPRYQSRKNISFARDAFSNWLTPHESDNTDVILIGHSLGGILAAEVVLFPSHRPGSKDLFQHRILGHIAFDTPFLGMHPGVISTGIASLFKSAPDPPEAYDPKNTSAPLSFNPFEAEPVDPNYNPSYGNDVNLPVRKGKLDQAFYFLNKHYGEWRKATTSYLKSHLEFGGCLADYDGLKKRYRSFRPLEDIDDLADSRSSTGKRIPRVRFVNYYTASTGRIKAQPPPNNNMVLVAETEMTERHSTLDVPKSAASSQPSTPRISIEEHRDGKLIAKDVEEMHLEAPESEMRYLEPQAEPPSPPGEQTNESGYEVSGPNSDATSLTQITSQQSFASVDDTSSIATSNVLNLPLPPLPVAPEAPPAFDPTPYTTGDPSTLKLAEKEHVRLVKTYERAKKDYEKAVRDREKHIAKLEKARQKQEEKENAGLSAHERNERARLKKEEERMQKEKERMEMGSKKEEIKRSATLNQEAYDAAVARQQAEERQSRAVEPTSAKQSKPAKKKKDRKFCTLPSKDAKTGRRDSTWIRVYMENMDEVVAHTSLFFVSETYAKLVGDTAERIEDWIRDAATVRAIRETQEWNE